MRTSLNEIRQIELYLRDRLSLAEKSAFESKLHADVMLRINVFLQQKIYTLVKIYQRQRVKHEAVATYNKLVSSDPSFHESLKKIFKP